MFKGMTAREVIEEARETDIKKRKLWSIDKINGGI